MSRLPSFRHLVSLSVCLLAGCDSGPKLYPLSGQVTYVNKPVKMGLIRFEPHGDKMDPRATPETLIRDGRYELPREKGVAGGSYTVYIRAFDGTAQAESPFGNALFPHAYVIKVDLPKEAATKDFDIPRQGK